MGQRDPSLADTNTTFPLIWKVLGSILEILRLRAWRALRFGHG